MAKVLWYDALRSHPDAREPCGGAHTLMLRIRDGIRRRAFVAAQAIGFVNGGRPTGYYRLLVPHLDVNVVLDRFHRLLLVRLDVNVLNGGLHLHDHHL